jgi:hypothetical protein
MDLELEKIKFIFSICKTNSLSSKLDKMIKKSSLKLLILGITDDGLKKYTCMPSADVHTGIGKFPVFYSKNSEGMEYILPGIISIFYYWKRLNCSLKKLNIKTVDVKNQYLPMGTIISFKDLEQVYDMMLLDSRVFVVLISGLRDHSSLVNEQILFKVLKMWSHQSI